MLSFTFDSDYEDVYMTYIMHQGSTWNSSTCVITTQGTYEWLYEKVKLDGGSNDGVMFWQAHIKNVKAGDTITGYIDNPYFANIFLLVR